MTRSAVKPAKRSLVALVGVASASMLGLTVAAGPASAAYAPTCSGFPFNVTRGDTYSAVCSHFPARKKGAIYEKQTNRKKQVTYVLGRFNSDRNGDASTGFVVSGHLHLGVQEVHVAAGGEVFAFNIRVHRA